MGHHIIEFYEKCKACKGTGLYIGLAERDGAAVVCHKCKGSGKNHVKIEYDDFEGREQINVVEQVFETNIGIVIGKGKGKFKLSDFGGMPYEEWLSGKSFSLGSENRRFSCPSWWYQSTDYDKKPHWPECIKMGSFSKCKHFKNKEACWERFDINIGRHKQSLI